MPEDLIAELRGLDLADTTLLTSHAIELMRWHHQLQYRDLQRQVRHVMELGDEELDSFEKRTARELTDRLMDIHDRETMTRQLAETLRKLESNVCTLA
ncbi:MAG: hypothetical protein ERJ67_03440 [Aphanocapsa feldmannii 277cV]|uniref:Uncharacterized protein n=2 Tax=Aphanocapsa feldmannii TaxID=192050 RepID=A0A524RPG6_9CHRO|nr:MAG: hypothetical protein ERJ69_05055 [Aphanocapsa feldmannii 288cV]TGG93709.1 MAG: hypothetical protein ERJ67_03440 [Aphanocapsa feldmannii 277cV]TGH20058.1 MAG: hypothetical protein ERJ68_07350 [Aphanocapsa feldmannii 277cI]